MNVSKSDLNDKWCTDKSVKLATFLSLQLHYIISSIKKWLESVGLVNECKLVAIIIRTFNRFIVLEATKASKLTFKDSNHEFSLTSYKSKSKANRSHEYSNDCKLKPNV